LGGSEGGREGVGARLGASPEPASRRPCADAVHPPSRRVVRKVIKAWTQKRDGVLRIAVVSGKGGVGKSTLVASLALTLRDRTGVGIADLDIEKPSIATILGVEDSEVSVRNDRFVPAKVRGIELVSSDLLFPSKAALLWSKRQEEEASAQMVELTDRRAPPPCCRAFSLGASWTRRCW